MKIFLTLKHWQLFLILFLPALLLGICVNIGPSAVELCLALFPATLAFTIVAFMGWLYTLGTQLHRRMPPATRSGLRRFQVFVIIPTVYILLVCVYLNMLLLNGHVPDIRSVIILFLLLHFFSMFCIFHSIWFVARALKTAEMQPKYKLGFSEYSVEFFLLWFFPVGIWFIQPRVNMLFAGE